jgi:membrane protease YdiL (CAAX protease family)
MDEYASVAEPAAPRTVPWTLRDIGKALIFPAILFLLGLYTVISGGADYDEEYTSAELIAALALGIAFAAFLLFISWWFSVHKYGAALRDLGVITRWRGGWWLPPGIFVAALGLVALYSGLLEVLGVDVSTDLPEDMLDDPVILVLTVVNVVVLAPVVEETFFRGFLFGGLRNRMRPLLAAFASGLIFGVLHLGNPGTIVNVAPVTLIGMMFALAYYWSGSIIPGMIAHFLFNAMSIAIQASL